MSSHEMTFFERFSIQMELVVPILRKLQSVLGEEAVLKALDQANQEETRTNREAFPAGVAGNCLTIQAGLELFSKGALEYDLLELDEEKAGFNVTSCKYAQMMKDLDAQDLGPTLICNVDFPMAEKMGLELRRTQTCMKGGSHCDFRYRARPAKADAASGPTD